MKLNRRKLHAGIASTLAVCAFPIRSVNAAHVGPRSRKILTISGRIRNFNNGTTAEFDRQSIEALEQNAIRTKTPWYDSPVVFEGVPMSKIMDHVGAYGDRVLAVALNDYTTEIPMSDFARYGVLLALKRDGEYMPVNDKGPLFIVYPYDSAPELSRPPYIGRSAWQVAQLVVK